jgi:ribosomal protein S18 acetylase RimI-like enzyme
MDVVPSSLTHVAQLKRWFPDRESAYFWCGPGLRIPFTDQTFLEDIHWQRMPAYSLLDDQGNLSGFGQYYEKLERCHLARLVIAPASRSRGLGRQFIARLMSIGMADLGVGECSLFVVNYNLRALRCYAALGFEKAAYPPGHEVHDDIDFMIRRCDPLAECSG